MPQYLPPIIKNVVFFLTISKIQINQNINRHQLTTTNITNKNLTIYNNQSGDDASSILWNNEPTMAKDDDLTKSGKMSQDKNKMPTLVREFNNQCWWWQTINRKMRLCKKIVVYW